jgi:ATP-dependent Clp protease ATP-binding subunit ClpA
MFANKLAEMRTIKEVLTSAESVAHEMGDEQPGAEHLLLSAIDLSDGLARRAFERVGANPDDFAMAIVRQHEAALAAAGIEVSAPSSSRVPSTDKSMMSLGQSGRAAFQRATKLVKEHRPAAFGSAHVVAAVAEQEHGTAARALAVMGVDREALREAAIHELEASR